MAPRRSKKKAAVETKPAAPERKRIVAEPSPGIVYTGPAADGMPTFVVPARSVGPLTDYGPDPRSRRAHAYQSDRPSHTSLGIVHT